MNIEFYNIKKVMIQIQINDKNYILVLKAINLKNYKMKMFI